MAWLQTVSTPWPFLDCAFNRDVISIAFKSTNSGADPTGCPLSPRNVIRLFHTKSLSVLPRICFFIGSLLRFASVDYDLHKREQPVPFLKKLFFYFTIERYQKKKKGFRQHGIIQLLTMIKLILQEMEHNIRSLIILPYCP